MSWFRKDDGKELRRRLDRLEFSVKKDRAISNGTGVELKTDHTSTLIYYQFLDKFSHGPVQITAESQVEGYPQQRLYIYSNDQLKSLIKLLQSIKFE